MMKFLLGLLVGIGVGYSMAQRAGMTSSYETDAWTSGQPSSVSSATDRIVGMVEREEGRPAEDMPDSVHDAMEPKP